MVGMVPVAGALAKIGKPTTDKNLTLNALLNGTCAYQMDVVTMSEFYVVFHRLETDGWAFRWYATHEHFRFDRQLDF